MKSVQFLLLLNIVRNAYSFETLNLAWNLALPLDLKDEQWLDQPLDHFNESDQRTFKIRYTEDLSAWKEGGPIFIYIGGEASISSKPFLKAFNDDIWNFVQESGGVMFNVEHRYYGKSKPFSFDQLNTENMAYLTSKQALADLSSAIKTFKASSNFTSSKVILIGGSYAGNLATWMNVIYPNTVDATLSSSAPVHAKKDFFEYLETVSASLQKYGSQDCVKTIGDKFTRYDTLMQTSNGMATLKQEENICNSTDLTIPENRQMFFFLQISHYLSTVQYGFPDDIQTFCSNVSSFVPTDKFEELGDCTVIDFDGSVQGYKQADGAYQWFYQTCNEFGYFMTTNSKNQIFTNNVPVSYFVKICTGLFGSDFDENRVDDGVANTNKNYGDVTPQVTNVVFSNGDIDPWHNLGVLQNLSQTAPSVFIEGSSHCGDIGSHNSDSLRKARDEIVGYIKTWINYNGE